MFCDALCGSYGKSMLTFNTMQHFSGAWEWVWTDVQKEGEHACVYTSIWLTGSIPVACIYCGVPLQRKASVCSVKKLLINFFWRSMAGTHRRLCGVCEATHRDKKYSGLTAAARGGFRNINVCTNPHRTMVGSRGRGLHWAEIYIAFSTLRTETFFKVTL